MTDVLLPPSASTGEFAIEATIARIVCVPTPTRDLWNASTCPENLLPWLAWALNIENWDPTWPIEVKRARVAGAIAIQRYKGSVQSVRDVIASFGGSVVLTEWWQQSPQGVPYTFTLELTLTGQNGADVAASYVDAVITEVELTMPVRCHFTFVQNSYFSAQVGCFAVVRPCIYQQLSLSAGVAS